MGFFKDRGTERGVKPQNLVSYAFYKINLIEAKKIVDVSLFTYM